VTVHKLATLFAQALIATSITITTSFTITASATSLPEGAHRHAYDEQQSQQRDRQRIQI
jgi:hypothetical protein